MKFLSSQFNLQNFLLKGNIFAEYFDKPFEGINCAIGLIEIKS